MRSDDELKEYISMSNSHDIDDDGLTRKELIASTKLISSNNIGIHFNLSGNYIRILFSSLTHKYYSKISINNNNYSLETDLSDSMVVEYLMQALSTNTSLKTLNFRSMVTILFYSFHSLLLSCLKLIKSNNRHLSLKKWSNGDWRCSFHQQNYYFN